MREVQQLDGQWVYVDKDDLHEFDCTNNCKAKMDYQRMQSIRPRMRSAMPHSQVRTVAYVMECEECGCTYHSVSGNRLCLDCR